MSPTFCVVSTLMYCVTNAVPFPCVKQWNFPLGIFRSFTLGCLCIQYLAARQNFNKILKPCWVGVVEKKNRIGGISNLNSNLEAESSTLQVILEDLLCNAVAKLKLCIHKQAMLYCVRVVLYSLLQRATEFLFYWCYRRHNATFL